MLLTDEEIMTINQTAEFDSAIGYAKKIIAAYEKKLLDQAMVECVTGKPIYQVWRSTDSCGEFYSWDDCDKYDYDEALEDDRRVLFEHPAPLLEDQIAEIKRKERERCAAVCGQYSAVQKMHYPDDPSSWVSAEDCAEAIRSLED